MSKMISLMEIIRKRAVGDKIPRKVKYKGISYCFDDNIGEYISDSQNNLFKQFKMAGELFNQDIEILDKRQKKLKKIKIDNEGRIQAPSTGNYCYSLSRIDKIIIEKMNDIIDYLIDKEKEDK